MEDEHKNITHSYLFYFCSKSHYKLSCAHAIFLKEIWQCFILYTESDEDLDEFLYIDVEEFYNNQRRFFTEVLQAVEVKELIKCLKTINIFEFTSLLDFIDIYEDFQAFVENNWTVLDMDNLIEI